MSYGGSSPVPECNSLENQISVLTKQLSADKLMIKAMDELARIHGSYVHDELKTWHAYGLLTNSIKENTKEIKALLKKQKKEK